MCRTILCNIKERSVKEMGEHSTVMNQRKFNRNALDIGGTEICMGKDMLYGYSLYAMRQDKF